MNKKLKKLVVLAFSSIFIIGILSGCGSTKSGVIPITINRRERLN
jgi:glycine betaine/proline transport system substrate-binding protein